MIILVVYMYQDLKKNFVHSGCLKKKSSTTPIKEAKGGKRTGVVLRGFDGFRATSVRRVLNKSCST